MEKRKPFSEDAPDALQKPTDLPEEFLKNVKEIFETHFESGLKKIESLQNDEVFFEVFGGIYQDEIVLSVSLRQKGQMAPTTVHASCDFDPNANAPKAEDLLSLEVDAVGSVFDPFLNSQDEEKMKQIASPHLNDIEDVPFHWTALEIEKRNVYVKMDKSRPELEKETEEWLEQNDPDLKSELDEEKQKRQQEKEEALKEYLKSNQTGKGGNGQNHTH